MTTVLFYILGFIMLAATLLCITRRNPVIAALFLVLTLFFTGGIFRRYDRTDPESGSCG